jgi:hypothetical protein
MVGPFKPTKKYDEGLENGLFGIGLFGLNEGFGNPIAGKRLDKHFYPAKNGDPKVPVRSSFIQLTWLRALSLEPTVP